MKTELSNKTMITCPHCGHQYVAGEIFMPGQLLGKSGQIVRDPLGKILYVEWEEEPELEEHFECDGCGRPFVVKATLSFKTEAESEELDFSDTTASLLG